MKWKTLLALILITLVIIPADWVTATATLPWTGYTATSSTPGQKTISLTFNFYIPGLDPPTAFTLTDLEGITASANWTKDPEASYTMIRISRFDYPTTPSEGELAYYGDNVTCDIPGIYFDGLVIYASAFSYEADNTTYSPTYATASIGEGTVGDIADELSLFNDFLDSGFLLLAVSLVFALVFWQRRIFLYALGMPVGIAYGTSLAVSGISDGSTITWVLGVVIAIIGTYFLYRIIEIGFNWVRSRNND